MNTPSCCPACGNEVSVRPSSAARDVPCPHCGHLLWFVRKSVDGVVVLTFLPELVVGSESIGRADEVVSAFDGSSRVVLNLAHLHFISSMFLGMLVVLHKRAVSAKTELKLCGIQPEAAVVFKITRLDKVFDICEDEGSALASF